MNDIADFLKRFHTFDNIDEVFQNGWEQSLCTMRLLTISEPQSAAGFMTSPVMLQTSIHGKGGSGLMMSHTEKE